MQLPIFYFMVFKKPFLKYGDNPSAIYKITFDTGHFYYGSSRRVKTRFVLWETSIKRNKFSNRLIKYILPNVSVIEFSIVQRVPNINRLCIETQYIEQYVDDPMCLNRRTTALVNGVGIKELPDHLRKPPKKYVKKENPKTNKKTVYKYSLNGDFVCTYNSILEAKNSARVNKNTFSDHLKVEKNFRGINGFIYRLTPSDNIKDLVLKKKQPRPKKGRPLRHNGSKWVLDVNYGIFYESILEAATLTGFTYKYLWNRVSGKIENNTNFIIV